MRFIEGCQFLLSFFFSFGKLILLSIALLFLISAIDSWHEKHYPKANKRFWGKLKSLSIFQ